MRHLPCLFVVILFCGGSATADERTEAERWMIGQWANTSEDAQSAPAEFTAEKVE